MKEIKGPIPNGGEYTCIFYYDENDNEVETEEESVRSSILEYDKDHKLIHSAITVKKDYIARLQEENKKKVIYKS